MHYHVLSMLSYVIPKAIGLVEVLDFGGVNMLAVWRANIQFEGGSIGPTDYT
jgi:hypothetical protein